MSITKLTRQYGLFLLPTLVLGQTGTGLKGDYFTNTTLSGVVALSKADPTVNFTWGQNIPAAGMPADKFSVRWSGQVAPPVSGAYNFVTYSDDGIRLWVDGKLVINRWNNHGETRDQSSAVTLATGRKYDIQLEYFDDSGNATARLKWIYPGQSEQPIPQTSLYPVAIALQAPPANVKKVYISDLPFLSSTNGWGPVQRDRSNGETGTVDGRIIKLNGTSYNKGLGVHAASEVRIALDDRFDTFKAVIGVDDEVGQNGSVIFEVWLDGSRKFQSPVMKGNMASIDVSVPTENAKELKLVVTNAGDGIGSDHADWADAHLQGVEDTKYLSDLRWTSATNGRGEVQLDRPVSPFSGGFTLGRFFLRGQSYGKGLGTFPAAEIRYALDKKYERFSAVLGIDDTALGRGSAIFEVWSGGAMLYRSDILRGNSAPQHLSLDVTDKTDLVLKVTDGGDGNNMDLADWADARLLPINSDGPSTPTPTSTVPAAPASLTAMPGNGLVNLSWQSVTGATSYNLYRGGSPNGQSSTPIAMNVTGTTYSNTGLVNGLTYYFKVKAVNGAGMGNASNEASATPTASSTPAPLPGAPVNLTAAPGNGIVNLAWQAASGAVSYNVYRGTASGGQSSTPIAMNITGTSFSNTGLTNGTKYFYKVKGVNAAGTGNASNETSATPSAPVTPVPVPAAPTNLTATAGNALVNLAWQAVSGATSYNLYRGTASGGQATTAVATNITGTTYSNTGLTNGTTYFYTVRGVNSSGASNPSNEASAKPEAPIPVPVPPTNLTATAGDKLVNLAWQAVVGATSYNVYRGTSANGQSNTPIATNVTATTYSNTGLNNGTTYFYKVRGVNSTGTGNPSNEASAKPAVAAPSGAPTNLTATPGNARVTLAWATVTGATSYSIYRGTATNAQATTPVGTTSNLTYTNTGLTNGTTYFYKVAPTNAGGTGPSSTEVDATPLAAPVAPVITAAPGDGRVTISWTAVANATTYNLYRGTTAGGQGTTPVATGLTGATYANTGLTNGTGYFFRLTAVGVGGESSRSNEVSSTPAGPARAADPATLSAFRLVRQTSFGPKPGEVDRVKTMGRTAYLDEQFNMAASVYPDTLYTMSVEDVQEHFMRLALTGNDQLRQRVAFALSKIWAVNAADVNRSDSTVNYYRVFMNRAFGNYRDLMTDVTLNPAMGRFLNMVNSRSQSTTNVPAVENFPRELLQLFTLGSVLLNPDGTPQTGSPYDQDDIRALARLFTGWTFGDGNPATVPNNSASENWRFPMEPVERYHDITAKTFLGTNFAPNRTARQDLDQALDVIFNHPNLPPYISKSLIKQLVTSNPSPAYVQAVTNVFINNGSGLRGDLRAVVRAILTHPEANLGTPTSGKLMEPILLVVSPLRTLNATVSDFPFMSDLSEEMGQKVFFPPSVFSYFSPFFQIQGGALVGPEFQLLTTVTALTRVNYIGRILNNDLSGSATIDYSAFTSRAADASALADYVALQFLGGQISTEHRTAVITAVNASPVTDVTERTRTAIYLVLTGAQFQVDR